MKILFVFNHPAPYKVELLKRIAKELDIFVLFERKTNKDRNSLFYEKEIPFPHAFLKGIQIGNENFYSHGIVHEIKKGKYDLIIMNGYSTFAEMIAIQYMIRHHIPYALYVNGGVVHSDPKWRFRLKRKLISHAFRYYSPTNACDEYLLHYGARKEDIRYFPYATITEDEIAKTPLTSIEREKILEQHHLSSKEPIFISVGQFIKRKNMEQLLTIFKDLPHLHLVLVGGGKEEKNYELFIEQNHMQNVTILPFLKRSELFPLMRASSGFILLSKEDIYGHVINEALSQGLGVIASDKIVAAHALIIPTKNGYIVPLDDNQKIISAIQNLLNDDCFDYATSVAKQNTYEVSSQIHIALWKEEE